PVDGAKRELKEETGLDVNVEDLQMVDQRELNNAQFFTFQCEVSGKPTGKNDPDKECSIWKFFDISKGIPKEVHQNMTGPRDKKKNILTDLVGLAKMQQLNAFPKLGIERRDAVPIIHGDEQANTKAKQIGWHLRTALDDNDRKDTDDWGRDTVASTHGAVVTTKIPVTTGFVHDNYNMRSRHPKKSLSPTSDLATKLHEDFHAMMGRVEN